MSALHELEKWSADIPGWLSDAARRAIQKGQLDSHDFDDLTAILMGTVGIPDDHDRKAIRLDSTMIPAEPPAGAAIALKAIRNLVQPGAEPLYHDTEPSRRYARGHPARHSQAARNRC